MRPAGAIGIVVGCAGLQVACSGGVLSGGMAGAAGGLGGRAGSGGETVLTGVGGMVIPSGGGGDPTPNCVQPYLARAVLPDIMIALDTSAAMNDVACAGCDTRWASAVDAINATAALTQAEARWGLELLGDGARACGTLDRVDVAPGSPPQAIPGALAARTLGGSLASPSGRPTRNAVVTATRHFNLQTDYRPGFIVLVTAGAPNCAPGAADPNGDDSAMTVSAIDDARTAGYGTFVIGLGYFDQATEQSMQAMATAGNPGLTGALPNYFTATDSLGLRAALGTVANATAGCTFEIPQPPNDFVSRGNISVRIGDLQVFMDANNGWTYTDASMTALRFHGTACELVKADRTKPTFITFNCLAV